MNKDVYSLLELKANAESMLSQCWVGEQQMLIVHCNSRYSIEGKKLFMFAKNFVCILLSDEKIRVIIQSSPQLFFFYWDKAKQIFSRDCCTVCALSMKCNPLKMSSLLDPKMCQRCPVWRGLDNRPLGFFRKNFDHVHVLKQ